MSLRETCFAAAIETDGLSSGTPKSPSDKIAETLQSQVINAFEAAIYQGMHPMDALAVILAWMSSEMMRIQADQAKRSLW